MVEIKKTENKIAKRIILALIIIMIPIILLVIFILGARTISPIFDYFEQQKFTTLDKEARNIYKAIKSVAPSGDEWKYGTGCSINHAGDWPDGTYQCVAISYMEKPVSSAEEVQGLHEKYYAILEKQSNLVTSRPLENIFGDAFGKEFVVSHVSKKYIEKQTEISCRYETYLGQAESMLNSLAYEDGAQIVDGKGEVTIMLQCEEKTDYAGYPVIKSTDGMIPDFTPNYDSNKSGWFF